MCVLGRSNSGNSHRAENFRFTSSHISHSKGKEALPSLSLYIKPQGRTLTCLARTHTHLRWALRIIYSVVTLPFFLTKLIRIPLQYYTTMCSGRWILPWPQEINHSGSPSVAGLWFPCQSLVSASVWDTTLAHEIWLKGKFSEGVLKKCSSFLIKYTKLDSFLPLDKIIWGRDAWSCSSTYFLIMKGKSGDANRHVKDGRMETDKPGALTTSPCHSINPRTMFSGKPVCRESSETDVQSQLKWGTMSPMRKRIAAYLINHNQG